MATTNTIEILIDEIILDEAFQPREGMDDKHVKDLRDFIYDGDVLPPVQLRRITDRGNGLYVVDGWHRITANKLLENDTIEAIVEECDWETAIEHSQKANMIHGKKLTNKEKWAIVRKALVNPRYQGLTERQLATRLGVSRRLIQNVKITDLNKINPTLEQDVGKQSEITKMQFYKSKCDVLVKENSDLKSMIRELQEAVSALQRGEQSKPIPTPSPIVEKSVEVNIDKNKNYSFNDVVYISGKTQKEVLEFAKSQRCKMVNGVGKNGSPCKLITGESVNLFMGL